MIPALQRHTHGSWTRLKSCYVFIHIEREIDKAMSPSSKPLAQKKNSSGRSLGLLSFGALFVALFLISACGTNPNLGSGSGLGSLTSSPTTTLSTPKAGSPTAGTTTPGTTAINATITYASVKFTIVDVQQAGSFTDDSRTSADKPGALRIDLKEESVSTRGSSYYLFDAVHLILPDSTTVELLSAKNSYPPEALVARTNWFDFAVPLSVDVKQLTLHFGTATEAPIDVLLTPNTDVGKYQTKISTPNKQAQYTNGTWTTNWTLTDASYQLSYEGKQADKGMAYVVVSLKIDNPSTRDYNGYPGDLLRLKTGDTVSSPSSWTIPNSVPAGTTNATGKVAFPIPQGGSNFTLTLMQNASIGTREATMAFQIS